MAERPKLFCFRLTEEERQTIEELARRRGVSPSAFVRARALGFEARPKKEVKQKPDVLDPQTFEQRARAIFQEQKVPMSMARRLAR